MNSVNVGASVTRDAVKALPVEGLTRPATCSTQNAGAARASICARDSDRPQAARVPAQARRRARPRRSGRILSKIDQLVRAPRAHEEDHRGAAVVREGQRRHRGLHARGDRRDGAADQRRRAAQQQASTIVRDYEQAAARARRSAPDHADPRESDLQREARARGAASGEPRAAGRDREGRRRRAARGARQRRRHLARESREDLQSRLHDQEEGPRLRPAQLRERRAADGRQPHGLQRRRRQGRELRAADPGASTPTSCRSEPGFEAAESANERFWHRPTSDRAESANPHRRRQPRDSRGLPQDFAAARAPDRGDLNALHEELFGGGGRGDRSSESVRARLGVSRRGSASRR